ncbi:DUF4291 family protein [Rhizobiales bacterium RZME27]|uniref:DUF4291 family protein n=1 Tax=Endobacterium cereale TaxID=2663029 RepID=A0A6A8A2W6_9HYPH|nr:DUF4291 family protein [Endobacterium cereale]
MADAGARQGQIRPTDLQPQQDDLDKAILPLDDVSVRLRRKGCNQKRVFAIDIKRTGFEEVLGHACISHYEAFGDETEQAWRGRLSSTDARI